MITSKNYWEINKFVLYAVVLIVVSAAFSAPKLYYLLSYERTEGQVVGYYDEKAGTRSRYTKHYPIVMFRIPSYEIRFLAPSYMYEETEKRNSYPVIYDSDNPKNAYVLTLLGFWGNTLLYFMPFVFCWSAFVFGYKSLPITIRLKKPF